MTLRIKKSGCKVIKNSVHNSMNLSLLSDGFFLAANTMNTSTKMKTIKLYLHFLKWILLLSDFSEAKGDSDEMVCCYSHVQQ